MRTSKDSDRFWKRVNKTDYCWEWTGPLGDGYGGFNLNGKCMGAHRASWILHNGSIKRGMFILHKCDNRKCVNPSHLYEGTPKDNTRDCIERKRNHNMKKTVCSRGHPLSGGNVLIYRTYRKCVQCRRDDKARLKETIYEAQKKALAENALPNETWKPVPSYIGLYEASNLGRIRSIAQRSGTKYGRIMATERRNHSYERVLLTPRNKPNGRKLVHDLIAEAFIGIAPSPDVCVRHKNGNKHDNRAENLIYGK